MILKKTPAPIVVPSLADSDAEYKAILDRTAALNDELRNLRPERVRLKAEIAADDSRDISPQVAELLGKPPSMKAENRKRLAEVNQRLTDIDTALGLLRAEQTRAESRASNSLCRAMRPEIGKRIAALIEKLRAVDIAHGELNDLVLQIEATGASVGTLGPVMPHFLGGARDAQRRIAGYIATTTEAGYAS